MIGKTFSGSVHQELQWLCMERLLLPLLLYSAMLSPQKPAAVRYLMDECGMFFAFKTQDSLHSSFDHSFSLFPRWCSELQLSVLNPEL